MNLLEKARQLRDKFSGAGGDQIDLDTIDNWIDEAKRLMLIQSLKNHDGVKYVREIFQTQVEKINQLLINSDSKEIPDSIRDRLIDRRNLANLYLDLFSHVDEQVEKFEENIDKELG